MKKKLIAIDLDGTTLKSDNTISNYTKDTFRELENLGHSIVITTGRPYRMAIDIYENLGLNSPMINFNGSMVSHPKEENWEYGLKKEIDKKFVLDMLSKKEDFKLDFLATEYKNKFFINNPERTDPNIFGVTSIDTRHQLETSKITENPHSLLLQTYASDKEALAQKLNQHYKQEINVSAWGGPNNILEVVPKNISKASALKHLLTSLNIDKSDLLAFGDEQNDVEMLSFAEESYAMKNSNPILFPHAKYKTKYTNDEDGVARTLSNLLL